MYYFSGEDFIFPLSSYKVRKFKHETFCSFLDYNEDTLFSLACNYFSLGQFELGRSTVIQLNSINSKKVYMLLKYIILSGHPPDWQLSPSVPSSAHLIFACIKEFRFLLKNIHFKNDPRNEFDLLLTQLILENSLTNISYNGIKEIRLLYNIFLNLITKNISKDYFFIHELKFLPKICVPSYLSRIPSYSVKSVYFFSECEMKLQDILSSKNLINELLNYSISSPKIFGYISKHLMMENFGVSCAENMSVGMKKALVSSLEYIRTSIQWIILKSCFSIIINYVEKNIPIHILRHNFFKCLCELKLEYLFFTNETNNNEHNEKPDKGYSTSYEKPLSFIFSFYSLLNFFLKYDLRENILIEYLKDNFELLKGYENICYNNSFVPKLILNFKGTRNNIFEKNYFLFRGICKYIRNGELSSNNPFDYFGKLLNSNLKEISLFNIVLDSDNSLIREYFGFSSPFGIISLTRFTRSELDEPFFKRFFNIKLLDFEILDNGPIYWCEFLDYLKVMKYRYEEASVSFAMKILSGKKREKYDFDLMGKLNKLFPSFRSLNTFLGLNENPIFNWKLIKNLWLPFRIRETQNFCSNENKLLTNKLDEISRQLIISILITKGLGLNYLENDDLFEGKIKMIFRMISTDKSIIRCCINVINESNNSERFKWRFIKEFISGLISLPITNGVGARVLIKERDCLKSYLIFEELFGIFNRGNSIDGSIMNIISIELGGLDSRMFHEELIYSCYCLTLIFFEKLNIKISLEHGNFTPNSFSFVFFYLFIWSNRLYVNNGLGMLKIITNIFDKYLSFVEFVLYSIPTKAPKYFENNNESYIFKWWYRDVLSIPIKAFKAGESLIIGSKSMPFIYNIVNERTKLRRVYKNTPWYSYLLYFEVINCIEIVNHSSIEHVAHLNIITSSSINIIRLLHIQNYEKVFNLIYEDINVNNEVICLTIDETIFQILIQKMPTFDKIEIILSLVKIVLEKVNDQKVIKLDKYLSIPGFMDSLVFVMKDIIFSPKNDIEFLIKFTPDLYNLCFTIDYYVSTGSKDDEHSLILLEIHKKIEKCGGKLVTCFEKMVIKQLRETFNKLNIFFDSGIPTSINKYILEIEALPKQDSNIKSHLDFISSKKIITTALTQSICYLAETSKTKSETLLNFINISNIINQSLSTLDNYGNINYLYSVLLYIQSILNEISNFSENATLIPILTLRPIEIISYSFFCKNNINGSNRLSKLMNENFLHMIVRAINNLKLSDEPNNISSEELEFFYSNFVYNFISFGLIVHNILPIENVDFGYKIWKFALYKINGFEGNKKLLYSLIEHRIMKYKLVEVAKEKIKLSNYSNIFNGIKSLIFTNYLNNFDKWIGLINILCNLKLNNLYAYGTSINDINVGFDLLPLNSSINIVVLLLLYQLSRNFIKIGSFKEISNIINGCKLVNLTFFPSLVYNIVINFIHEFDPNSLLNLIDMTLKNMTRIVKLNIKYFNGSIEFIQDNMFTIFFIIREFCIEYMNSFNDTFIWSKWSEVIRSWTSKKGIIMIISFFIELNLFNLAKFISENLLYKIIEKNGNEEFIKNMLFKLSSEDIDEISSISNFEHNKLVLEVNNVISSLRNSYILEKRGFKLISIFQSKIKSFETITKLFDKIKKAEDKYLFIETLISSQSIISDINRVNVLKTISLSLKIIKELNSEKIKNVYLYSPYLILRIFILKKDYKVLDFLAREIEVFLRSDSILLDIIEESFGINSKELLLKERIKNSSIFGQANFYNCFKLFPIIKEEEFTIGFDPLIKLNTVDICFSIKLLSLLPKSESVCNFVFNIVDKLSAKLNIFFKEYMLFYSSVKHTLKDSFIWIKEEGVLKTNTNNLHPFSRFKNSRQSAFNNNNLIGIYREKKYLTKKYIGTIYRAKSNSVVNNTSNSLSTLRIHIRNIIKLLRWGEKNFDCINFSIIINSFPLLFEFWLRIPGMSISLKDLIFTKYDFFLDIISVDQIDLAKSILNLNATFSKSGERKLYEFDSEFLRKRNLIYNSIVFSDISLNFNNLIFGQKYKSSVITKTNSKSRNEMILEIFLNKWKVSKFKNVDIEIFDEDTINLIEHSFLSRFGILNLSIISIFLTSMSWTIKMKNSCKNNKFLLPLNFVRINYDVDIIKLFEVYHNTFDLNRKIRRKPINTGDFLKKWINIYTISQLFEPFFQGACTNQNLLNSVLALEHILNILKGTIFLVENEHWKVYTGRTTPLDHYSFGKKISIYNKMLKYNMINQLLLHNNQNHISTINSLVKFNFWWETMVYILRWSFELGHSKSRSLVNNDKNVFSNNKNDIKSFDVLYCELVVKKAHSLNKLGDLMDAMNKALPYGGPRATITIRKCKQIVQKYLEHYGALEMLYTSIICTALNHDISHAVAGTIAIHLSLTKHINFDARMGYLNLAFHHFTAANWSLKRRLKIGSIKKQQKAGNSASSFQIIEREYTDDSFQTTNNTINCVRKMKNILIDFIGDVHINSLNISPWGGLSQTSLQKIIKLIELQESINFNLIRESSQISILSPKYEDRRDTIIKLFLKSEFPLGFKACEILDVPLLEVLVHTTKCLIESYPTNKPLLKFIDSMKHWLPVDDVDALVSNAVNVWISEKRINLNLMEGNDKRSIIELINKFENSLSKREAYNMINISKTIVFPE
ncbi:hypothetical protein FG386_000290 [Cryptosporidium ryanae]|uniref:uncharacterized protein n=1 Tax=Cryptosporidium ryanae TaxID=515981 RepID=UPI00351A9E06|nr:hypothetical protein FG386_000290 [Cryptosporidium ryanae]